MKDYLYWIY